MKTWLCKVIVSVLVLICTLPAAFSAGGQLELDTFVSDFVSAVSQYDADWLDDMVDIEAFMDKVAAESNIKALEVREFRKGFAGGMRDKFSLSLIAELRHHGGYATFIKYIRFDGSKKPIIRLDYPDGMMNYFILDVVRVDADSFKISDVFFTSTGQYFSQTVSNLLSLSVDSSTGFLDKVQGKERFNKQMTEVFSDVTKHRLNGDYQKAYNSLISLPKDIRHSDPILQVSFGLSSSLSEEIYKKELTKLIEYSSSLENKEFLLIDYYFYKKDYKKTIEVIDLFEERYVEDGAINLLRSNMQYLDGDLDSAIWSAVRCTALEPMYEECYWNLIELYNEAKQFDKVVEQITILETDFGYELDIQLMEAEPIYSEFIKSRSYKDWISE